LLAATSARWRRDGRKLAPAARGDAFGLLEGDEGAGVGQGRVVAAHGGHIAVKNRGGAVFQVSIPAA